MSAVAVPTPDKLRIENAHPRDVNIVFNEEGHKYTVCNRHDFISTTTIIHTWFAHFDEVGIIAGILRKRDWSENPDYKYYKMSAEEISKMWKDNGTLASGLGTKMHFNIECYFNGLDVVDDSVEFSYFKQYVADVVTPNRWSAYRTEMLVYDEELLICGSIDMLYSTAEAGHFVIADWKRSKEITYTGFGGKCATEPCIAHMPDCNFSHYSLQLNIYRRILEKNYGFIVDSMHLVILHPNNTTYLKIDVPVLNAEIDALFRARINRINNIETIDKEVHNAPDTTEHNKFALRGVCFI